MTTVIAFLIGVILGCLVGAVVAVVLYEESHMENMKYNDRRYIHERCRDKHSGHNRGVRRYLNNGVAECSKKRR